MSPVQTGDGAFFPAARGSKPQNMINDWLNHAYLGNTLRAYLIALGILIGGIIVLKLLGYLITRRLARLVSRTKTELDDFALEVLVKNLLPLLYAGVVYLSIKSLQLSAKFVEVLHVAMVVVSVYFVVQFVVAMIAYGLRAYFRRTGREQTGNSIRGLMIIVKVLLFTFGLVFLLDNLGYNVATVLTGLGIGGIAIALAAQTILGDLFAYFSILFDRPFEVGDFLIVEDKLGTVAHIGIKTTRIDSLSGEKLIYSNKKLTETWMHNYARMQKRRAVFGFNVSYDTPPEKLEQIPGVVKKIVASQPETAFDRAHFASFQESYLHFEVVYYSLSPDYTAYMDKQQAINLAIMRAFREMSVSFAFPTRTVKLDTPPQPAPGV